MARCTRALEMGAIADELAVDKTLLGTDAGIAGTLAGSGRSERAIVGLLDGISRGHRARC
ncbi:MAG: hypothetical protein OER22_01155 [Gammaproteobacteria bacterium]|nr:hypothetical protein [Gammaproteobacteria bacterium]MDH3372489.1 hypothetical protein [Gammaproteobacteria bacterium]MDH3409567.1 hypothetical protein [Gammaproteobacteria bacterium]MDH3551199.1 hypothetical protein [Gammaproteobacteria bacterium]